MNDGDCQIAVIWVVLYTFIFFFIYFYYLEANYFTIL